MNSQQSLYAAGSAPRSVQALPAGRVFALGASGGRVSVVSGKVWLTSAGDAQDHVLGAGDTVSVASSGRTLVEAWTGPAQIDWQPRTLGQRLGELFAGAFDRCWEFMHPLRRLGIGSVAALAALAAGVLVFGPVSEERTRALASPPAAISVLHNAPGVTTGAAPTRGSLADASRDRPRSAAQEARRRAPGAA